MKKIFLLMLSIYSLNGKAQTNPAISSWLQNTKVRGRYYLLGNSTRISSIIFVNCQLVGYSNDCVYVNSTGITSYIVGAFTGYGNPTGNHNVIFKFLLNPTENTGTKTANSGGNNGVFRNGVAMFDLRDGVALNTNTYALCNGPENPTCTEGTSAWYRDEVIAEKPSFNCSKGYQVYATINMKIS